MIKQFIYLMNLSIWGILSIPIIGLVSCGDDVIVQPKTKSEVLAGLEKSNINGIYSIDGLKKNMLVQLFEPYVIEDDITIVHGWAVDPIEQETVKELWISLDTLMFPIYDLAISRPDVAAHFNDPKFENVGYSGAIYTKGLGLKKGNMSVVVVNRDKQTYFEAEQSIAVQFK